MDHRVVDNFLSLDESGKIRETLLGDYFPWYINDVRIHPEYPVDETIKIFDHQMTHLFYRNYFPKSDFIHIIDPLIKKINPLSIIRIKANLLTGNNKKIVYGYHKDYDDPRITTAIYYVNTNNGETIFKDGCSIQSIENRLLCFNSAKFHTGTNPTDSKYRCVINFNYIT